MIKLWEYDNHENIKVRMI